MSGRSSANTTTRFWLRILGPMVGVSLVIAVAACGGTGQTADTQPQVESTEPQPTKILDSVSPVGLWESRCTAIGEVSLSPEAAAYEPPEVVSVYRIQPVAPVTRESMDALADQFGFVPDREYGDAWLRAPGRLLHFMRADDVASYRLEGGGGQWQPYLLTPEESAAMEAGVPLAPPPPATPEETRAAADAFLQKWGVGEGLTFKETYEASAYGTATLDGKEERWVTSMGARYQAYVDGVRLVGAGAKVSMEVDSAGNVFEFLHFAEQAVESEYAVTIRPVEAALADLKAGRGEVPPDITDERAGSITVESIDICYYAAPVGSAEMYYKPVYVFRVRMSDGTLGEWRLSAFEGSTAPGAI